jgi:hypothetical protein
MVESRMTRPGHRYPLPNAWPATIFLPFGQPGIWDQIMEALAAAHDGAIRI